MHLWSKPSCAIRSPNHEKYLLLDHILQIRVSQIQTVHEVLQDWHTNISYAKDGSIVEIVLIDANKEGLLPLEYRTTA